MSVTPEYPQSREELLLNKIAGNVYSTEPVPPQSRIEKWLAFIAENGIPGNVKIGDDVATVADLPTEGMVGEMHYVTAESLFYVYKVSGGTGEWIPVGADFDPSEFARADGTYPDMTVGKSEYADVSEYSAYAEQLDSNQKLTVSTPFVFRPAGGGADVEGYLGSRAEIRSVYGKTLVWNQLVPNGNFDTDEGWATVSNCTLTVFDNIAKITVVNPSEYFYLNQLTFPTTLSSIENHRYLISVDVRSSVDTEVSGYFGGVRTFWSNILTSGVWHHADNIIQPSIAHNGGYICGSYNPATGDTIEFRNFNIIDLTKMFGAGNEPSTVEEFRSLFPLSYYAYDAGRLLNFNGTGIKTVGFNALAPDGTAKLLGGHEYEIVGTYTALSYSTGEIIAPVDGIFTPTADGILTVTGANAETCVHLTWSGYRNGETAAYKAETKMLPISTYFPDGMKSIESAYDELHADRAITRIESVDISSITWSYIETTSYPNGYFSASIAKKRYGRTNVICEKYDTNYVSLTTNNIIRGGASDRESVFIVDHRYHTVSDLLRGNVGVKILYEIEESIETPIDPPLDLTFTSTDFGTELLLPDNDSEPVTTPMYADIDYVQNLRDKLQRLPMSPMETGDYYVHFDGVKQTLVKLPELPAGNGTYALQCVTSGGGKTLKWEAVT